MSFQRLPHLTLFGFMLSFCGGCYGNLRPSPLGNASINQDLPNSGIAENGAQLDLSLAVGGPALLTSPADEDAFPAADEICANSFHAGGTVSTLKPRAYVKSCAGCHGPDAAGHQSYPSLHGVADYNTFVVAIRQGIFDQQQVMPAFDNDHLDDNDMRRIWSWLTKTPLTETKSCTPRPAWSADQIEASYQAGLKAFRTTSTERDGRACTQCHSPDGLVFAYMGFSDGDILRRANTHLTGTDQMAIVDMVEALKQRYHLPRRDPLLSRPFQPGTIPLQGNTILERDQAFGQELQDFNLIIATQPINSVSLAIQAEQQLLNLNLHALRIPLIFNRFSEDIFHNPDGFIPGCGADIDGCADHGSIADWVPVAAHLPGNLQGFLSAEDTYLKKTTWKVQDLKTMLAALPNASFLEGSFPDPSNRYLDHEKYSSEFLLDFCIRQELTGANPNCYQAMAPGSFTSGISTWNIGSYAKRLAEGTFGYASQTTCDTSFVGCDPAQPQMLYNNITPGAKLSDNMQRLGNPWFALQWQHFDPALMNTGDNTAQLSEYFTRALFWADNDGDNQAKASNPAYSNYAAFHVAMHNVALLNQPSTYDCNSKMPFFHPDLGALACTSVDVRSGLYPEMTNFAEGKSLYNDSQWQMAYMPKDQPRRSQYQMLAGNLHRLFLWKLIGALQQSNWMCKPEIEKLRIARAKTMLATSEIDAANGSADTTMFSTLATLMSKTQTKCPPFSPSGP